MADAPALDARDVVKEFHTDGEVRRALDGVSLSVGQGRFLSIMGPSGSGKSTLLQLLGGLDRPTSGEVILAGTALSACSEAELTGMRRTMIGFVFQAFNLIPVLTVEENVALPLVLDGRTDARAAARVDELIGLVGLGDRRHQRPAQLSGGEQQRTAIARALAGDPQVLLADEPTGSLDSATGADVVEILRAASTDLGRTVVVVTHDARVAARGDEIADLRDGRIVGRLDLAAAGGAHGPDQVMAWLAANQ